MDCYWMPIEPTGCYGFVVDDKYVGEVDPVGGGQFWAFDHQHRVALGTFPNLSEAKAAVRTACTPSPVALAPEAP